ncbi:MAG: T9SS type A sorting domain-containing protein [Saprospiraceae bacterium]|nr:T9SS type A sorting domain-containing protein [Saprospiraceae bacterium]
MRLVEGVGIETETTGFYLDSSVSFFAYCEGTLDECNIISSTKDNQTEHLEKIEIYQNPTDDNIHIEFSKNNLFQRVFLSDHFGTNLIEKTIYGENTINLDVSKLPAGLYFINFINNKTIHVEKVFISK